MSQEYNPKEIEKKWQEEWEKSGIYTAKDSTDNKYYSLMEFPYPSGDGLHTGHVRGYTAMDIISRKRRMEGKNVMFPIGWDAFGLPTENYALKTGKDPRVVTQENSDNFRTQFKRLGMSFDWSREINTTDPAYYKWTQWIFLKFLEKGLAYKAKMPINWCPKDKIGLANEEVVDGKCERCGTEVEQKEKEQWMLAITKYADRLDKDLDEVDYPERVKTQQRNWIGKSEGALIKFDDIEIFTTRPDTIYGGAFIGIPGKEDKFTGRYVTNPATKEKIPVWELNYVMADYGTGAVFGDAHDQRDFDFAIKNNIPLRNVIDPVLGIHQDNPEEKEKIVALVEDGDKVLTVNWKQDKGWRLLVGGTMEKDEDPIETAKREIAEETGYVDLEFITMGSETIHYQYFSHNKNKSFLAHTKVLHFRLNSDKYQEPKLEENEKGWFEVEWITKEQAAREIVDPLHKYAFDKFILKKCFDGKGILKDSGEFSGLTSDEAISKITEKFGTKVTKYKLRDWVFSRQRYWGEPIPVIHCDKCGIVPVPEKDLPVLLPVVEKYEPGPDGESPLANIAEWVNVKCPKCGGEAKRETDVMPNWAGSSWYFYRYTDYKNDQEFASADKLKNWMPVDWYNGGMEHTVLHLLYSRFWNKFLYDLKLVPTNEPYKKRTSHGIILAEGGKEKMSKSKGNVINPDKIVEQFGADTLRVYEMFMGPFEQAIAWSDGALVGPRRFLERVWKIQDRLSITKSSDARERGQTSLNKVDPSLVHQTIKKVSDDIEAMRFNTAISTMMIFANALDKQDKVSKQEFETLLILLAPFAPHITEELWQTLGNKNSIHTEPWPQFDPEQIEQNEVVLAIQVDGKLRGSMPSVRGKAEEEVKKAALNLPEIQKWLEGKEPKKVIVVPNKIISIVTAA